MSSPSSAPSPSAYWCHTCNSRTTPSTTPEGDLKCPKCQDVFVEQMETQPTVLPLTCIFFLYTVVKNGSDSPCMAQGHATRFFSSSNKNNGASFLMFRPPLFILYLFI